MAEPLKVRVWPRPVRGVVTVPGSKSYTNRALLLAAMTPGPVRVERPLYSDDTRAMLGCLKALGIEVRSELGAWVVLGDVRDVKPGNYDLDADLSGITIRFLLALACVVPGEQVLRGKAGLNKRPIGELVDGLRQLGADIEYVEAEGFPPVRVRSTALKGGVVRMPGGVSSQYFSAILQIGPLVQGDLEVEVEGEQISKPYIDMTIDTMRRFGVTATNEHYRRYRVAAEQTYAAASYEVEGDYSSAGYFFAVAALTGSNITVRGVNPDSAQADRRFLDLLEGMGNVVRRRKNQITVVGRGVKAGHYDMTDCPDQAMTLAVLLAFAQGKSVLSGVRSLRVKETERVVALEQELAKMGIRTDSTHDTLVIHGGKPHGAIIDTYGDHRMAMAFAVAGTKLDEMVINDPEVVSKTYPGFWEALDGAANSNVVLIGMRGTGKTATAKGLAHELGMEFMDMDAEVMQRAGMSVSEIVERHGWDYFRNLEAEVAAEVGARRGSVISCGGGVVLRPENVAALSEYGTMVLLEAPPAELAARIQGDTDRPPLTAQASLKAELAEVWQQRETVYRAAADVTVDTSGLTIAETVAEVIKRLGDVS